MGELLAGFAETPVSVADRAGERTLLLDSRTVHPGDVFFAVRGGQRHGLEFLESVRSAGVLAVLWEPPWDGVLPADDARYAAIGYVRTASEAGWIASRFYGELTLPALARRIASPALMAKRLVLTFSLSAQRCRNRTCGILGTWAMAVFMAGLNSPSLHTTPDTLCRAALAGWFSGG
ncbi:MAG: hypothetical protein H6976_15925 [Gammaproteobacteria bacterium]|nr:hypothetical protein [Gammaproteobacteria bacterium]